MRSDMPVAFLAYYPEKQRQANNSFEGNYNIGANVVMDVLARAGMECGLCTADTSARHRVVLVSLTSDYDVIAFYRAVALLPSWQPGKREFVVVAGGAGMQNPTAIRRYVDYAVFGRAEGFVADLVGAILGGGAYGHESVMRLPEIHPVKLAQPAGLYPHPVKIGAGKPWRESFVGCPNKCLFCHYTWARKHMGAGTYYQGDLTRGKSVECLWKDIPRINEKPGRLRSAIDGFSERLREAYGKRIKNAEIISAINHLGSFHGNTVVLAYNISNMPHETEDDRQELYSTIRAATPEHRVILVLQSTPFRPSLLTPMQWSPVALRPATSDLSASVIHDTTLLRAIHSFSNESPWSQLQTVIVSRATPATDKLFHAICFHPKLRSGTASRRIGLLQRSFDLSPYLRAYDPGEKHPAWFLSSYTPTERLRGVIDRAEGKL